MGVVQEVAAQLETLSQQLAAGDFHLLPAIRETVLGLKAPKKLVTTPCHAAMAEWGVPDRQEGSSCVPSRCRS